MATLTAAGCGAPADVGPSAPTAAPPTDRGLPVVALRCADDLDVVPGCFAAVPAGEALVGAQSTDPGITGFDPDALPAEGPPRRVEGPPLWVMISEATNGMYAVCVAAGACPAWSGADAARDPSRLHGLREMFPVQDLSAAEAEALCRYLGGRLPAGDEWERAARGGDGRRFAWGNTPACPYARPPEGADARSARNEAMLAGCPELRAALDALTRPEVESLGAAIARWPDAEAAGLCDRVRGLAPADAAAVLSGAAAATFARAAPAPCDTHGEVVKAIRHEDHHPWRLHALSVQLAEWTADPGDRPGERQVRGGSYLDAAPAAWRLAARRSIPADVRRPEIGVRCVRDTAPEAVVTPAVFDGE